MSDYNPSIVWDQRAEQYGRRAVLDLGLSPGEAEALTALQEEILLYRLDSALNYDYFGRGLDFGCGVGRFAKQLAVRCERLICYDPSPKLVKLGLADNAGLRNKVCWTDTPLGEFLTTTWQPFRFIWISLVLGGIPDSELPGLALLLGRLVSLGGVILFAEHISESAYGSDFWRFRSSASYLGLFQGFKTRLVDAYITRGNTVGVFVARKC